MNRRDFLKYAAIVGSGLLLPETAFANNIIFAGNLYFRSLSQEVTLEQMRDVFSRTLYNFYKIGIGFNDAEMVDDFKSLSGLDLCVVLYDSEVEMEKPLEEKNNGYYNADPEIIRHEIDIPYEDQTLRENCCFVFPNVVKPDQSPNTFTRNLTSAVCHEIGHGYGATHVYDNRKFESNRTARYIMATRRYGKEFDPLNQERMRSLILDVNTNGFDRSRINRKRNESNQRDIFLDEITAQESSLSGLH